MDITEQCVVALTWTLKDTLGEVLDVLDEPVEFLVGGDDLLPRIEQALQGHGPGARLDLHIEPEEAFGDFNDQLLFLEPRNLFPAELEEGMTIEGSALPKGTNPEAPRNALYTVTEIYPEHVVLDGNHPLAGIAIRLSLKVEAVREATEEEIGRGTCGTGFFRIDVDPDGTAPRDRPALSFTKNTTIPAPIGRQALLKRKRPARPNRVSVCRSIRSRPRRAHWARQIRSPR
jgi:FKBP-type peptidyl-prolyl cis-trans isomerase SlyD